MAITAATTIVNGIPAVVKVDVTSPTDAFIHVHVVANTPALTPTLPLTPQRPSVSASTVSWVRYKILANTPTTFTARLKPTLPANRTICSMVTTLVSEHKKTDPPIHDNPVVCCV